MSLGNTWSAYPHQIPLVVPSKMRELTSGNLVRTMDAVMHRRAGKTEAATVGYVNLTNEILAEQSIFKLRKNVDSWNPKLGFMAETKENARNIVWGYWQKYFGRRKDAKLNNHRLTIEIPRRHIGDKVELSLHAFRDHDKVRGEKFRYIHVDEVQKMRMKDYRESIYSTLADSGGGCGTTGTASALGDYKEFLNERMAMGAPVMMATVDQTELFDEKEKAAILKEIGPFAYRQEYLCDFTVSTIGTFWEKHLLEMEKEDWFYTATNDPGRLKVLAVDIGVDKGFAAWYVQIHQNGLAIDVLDYYTGYETLSQLREDHIKQWGGLFDIYIIPSDAKTRRLEARKKRTSEIVFREAFPECRPIILKQSKDSYLDVELVTDNISMLRFPPQSVVSDAHQGLQLLKKYRRKEDANGNLTRQIYKGDDSSHCGDAMKYLFLGLRVKYNRVHYIPSFRVGQLQQSVLPSWARTNNYDMRNEGSLMSSFFNARGGW